MKNWFLILVYVIFFSHSYALEFDSGEERVRLVELYTSQSCSSCPPAEKWISNFKTSKGLWSQYIPIAYHVAYWNHLHWKDTFSKEEFSRRQRAYHQVIQGGVYTPQVVLDGKDFRAWRGVKNYSQLKADVRPGNLNVSIDQTYSKAQLSFTSNKIKDDLLCFAAYVESGYPVKVTSGENKGRTLKQDFIVRDLFKNRMTQEKNNFSCHLNIATRKTSHKIEKALVFWLVNKKTYQVVQATGGKII